MEIDWTRTTPVRNELTIVVFVVIQPHVFFRLFFLLLHGHVHDDGNNYKESVTWKNLENP